jgi:hypothetical protein
MRASYRLEQRKVNPAWSGVALKYQPQLDTSPLHLHRDESGETKMAWIHAAVIASREKRQPQRDLDAISIKRHSLHQISQRRGGFSLRAQAFNQALRES